MPTYDYRATDPEAGCERCRDGFSEFQWISDASLTECPDCGGAVARTLVPFGIQVSKMSMLSDKNLKAHGFQKLKRDDDGNYKNVL